MAKFVGDMLRTPRPWDLPDLVPEDGAELREQVAGAIRRAIADGRFRPGQRVPNQAGVARRYGVPFNAVRRAYDLLADEGVLRLVRGLGHFVVRRPEGDLQ
jgi:DNA-binding GntR family transcriptional regulator